MANFGQALAWLRTGHRVYRQAWGRDGRYITLQQGYPQGIPINANTARATGLPEGTVCRFQPYLMERSSEGTFVPWNPDVPSVLAEDWGVTSFR